MSYGTYKGVEPLRGIMRVKSADESKTNDATALIDTDVQAQVSANTRYRVHAMLRFTLATDNSGADWLLFGTAGFGTWTGYRLTQFESDAPFLVIDGASGGPSAGVGTAGEYMHILDGVLEITTAGSLGILWGQATSDAGAVTFKKGSYLRLEPI